jgi:hypothetical protein
MSLFRCPTCGFEQEYKILRPSDCAVGDDPRTEAHRPCPNDGATLVLVEDEEPVKESTRVDLRNEIENQLFSATTNKLTHFGRQLLDTAIEEMIERGEVTQLDNSGKVFKGTLSIAHPFNLQLSEPYAPEA